MARIPFSSSAKTDRLLVVDDLPDNSFLIQAILEEEGFQIDVEDNGKSALERIEVSPPDLILLDVMMPGIDGYEVTRRVRQNENLPFIPILLITAYDQPSVVKGLDLGADEFIRKPVEVDELLARVRSLLRLKHSLDERDAIARQREDFVSRLTHDLRTPMVAADRMLGLFLEGAFGEIPEEMEEALITLARSNQNLLEMVNTLLQVYRYEAGRQTLNLQAVDLSQVIEEVAQELEPLVTEEGLSLVLEITDSVPSVEGDRLELRRVVTNLIGNAIKFTDQGRVEVRLYPLDLGSVSGPSGRWIKLEVQDSGPGIDPKDQSLLFERFGRGRHRLSGSGLGLHLSRCIVEAHQGEISLESSLGQGSCFGVQIPVKQSLH